MVVYYVVFTTIADDLEGRLRGVASTNNLGAAPKLSEGEAGREWL